MSQIEWKEQYTLGNKDLDEDIKKIVERMNKILHAYEQPESQKDVLEELRFLGNELAISFSRQEYRMKEYLYPPYFSHKREHDSFLEKYKKYREEAGKEGELVAAVMKIRGIIEEWLENHVIVEDKKLVAFLKKKEQGM
ncbi:hemerythrin [Caldicellulosiruptor bescii]|uniref:Hemerythrin-like metal-binding protein n=2 Tax=Caldicellulosiruptor bescii TaxID=31899 RepID=B9MP71_CALBD|nr:hemerythrin family protein [Caldicellulosiruptor bescii]ACM61630.1 hemerythrin-like metal-binding protein [Caldicellulosiruptor bescii DSM 6725]PBC88562.1 hemerythrin [Caldicellulosiruptor bescii]PBC91957.1 hemerythrin [Caldicellulosiruptor bescii]PBD02631.1 hemerythrin [Caldicellulosiruptor bescii]PBD05140.1 hemerythrin [Caldicellulosiruptor bescii]